MVLFGQAAAAFPALFTQLTTNGVQIRKLDTGDGAQCILAKESTKATAQARQPTPPRRFNPTPRTAYMLDTASLSLCLSRSLPLSGPWHES